MTELKFKDKPSGLVLILYRPAYTYIYDCCIIIFMQCDQGMDDKVVPPSMTDFVHRILPGAAVHKLPYEGHFTYIYFCDECHRQIFTTLFGTPQGPLRFSLEADQTTLDVNIEQPEEVVDTRPPQLCNIEQPEEVVDTCEF